MNEVRAFLKNYRQSSRKVRIVADTMRGKKVEDAMIALSFIPKHSSLPLKKLLSSAVANAKNQSLPIENLIVGEIKVDAGPTLWRRRSRSKGMANPIRKRTSRVSITLTTKKS